MDFKILDISRANITSYALMGLQVAILIGIATILVSALGLVGVPTAASMAIMFILGLPLLILHYFSATDKFLKAAFFGFIGTIAFLSIAGMTWYILPAILNFWWLVPAAKVLMVAAYLPLLFALYWVYWGERRKIALTVRLFVLSVNTSFSVGIAILALSRMSVGDPFNIGIYSLSVLADIVTFTLAALIIVLNPSIRPRYIFSIVFLYMLSSFFGDVLNLTHALGLGQAAIGSFSNYFYDFMLLFLVAGLLLYSLFKDDNADAVQEANKKLGDMCHSMEDLISQMPDAACVFTTDGSALIVNEPFLHTFGVSQSDIIGRFNLFQHAATRQCDLKDKLGLLKEGKAVYLEKTRVFMRGREIYLSFKLFPTYSMDGTVSGYVAICEDVTSWVYTEEELKQAKSMVELYIDLMGHDINNMNQVGMGYLEIALDTLAVTAEQKTLLVKPLEAMTNSSKLIDNVKKLRRASKGDIYLQAIDLGNALKEVIEEHGQAPGRDVLIKDEVPSGTMVMANELLKDVFANLVGNAIKHSGGTVRISIRREPFEIDGKKYLRIFVEDNGPGIPEEAKPMIFDRLLRGRNRTGGSGIGLYLVKTLIDSYGGSISVEDRVPGDFRQGTRFIVVLRAAV